MRDSDYEYSDCGKYHMHPQDQTAAIVMGALGMLFGLLGGICGMLSLFH